MITATKGADQLALLRNFSPDTMITIPGSTWEEYMCLVEENKSARDCKLAFDGASIEMMVVSNLHDGYVSRLDVFIVILTLELGINHELLRSPSWVREALKRGIIPDSCHYFSVRKSATYRRAMKNKSKNGDDYPSPDLAVEVDITRPSIDRDGIYAALRVPELWIVCDEVVTIKRLTTASTYVPAKRSRYLPVSAAQITEWAFGDVLEDELSWKKRLIKWAKTL